MPKPTPGRVPSLTGRTSAPRCEEPRPASADDREQMQMLTIKNSLLATYLSEMGHMRTNFERALGTGPEGFAAATIRRRGEQADPGVARATTLPDRERHER